MEVYQEQVHGSENGLKSACIALSILIVFHACPEACGLWIEEELERSQDTKASLRAIGRIVAAEIEKRFEVTVSPDAIRMRATKIKKAGGKNLPPKTTTQNDTEKGGFNVVSKLKSEDAVSMVEDKVKGGSTKNLAIKEVAKETGLNENSVRRSHQRAEKKEEVPKTPSFPMLIH